MIEERRSTAKTIEAMVNNRKTHRGFYWLQQTVKKSFEHNGSDGLFTDLEFGKIRFTTSCTDSSDGWVTKFDVATIVDGEDHLEIKVPFVDDYWKNVASEYERQFGVPVEITQLD